MGFLSSLIGAPLVWATFKMSPNFVAKHALYGELSGLGYSKAAFPPEFIEHMSGLSLSIAKMESHGRGTFSTMISLQKDLHVLALQIHSLMTPHDVHADLARTAKHVHEVMVRFGMSPVRAP